MYVLPLVDDYIYAATQARMAYAGDHHDPIWRQAQAMAERARRACLAAGVQPPVWSVKYKEWIPPDCPSCRKGAALQRAYLKEARKDPPTEHVIWRRKALEAFLPTHVCTCAPVDGLPDIPPPTPRQSKPRGPYKPRKPPPAARIAFDAASAELVRVRVKLDCEGDTPENKAALRAAVDAYRDAREKVPH